MQQYWSNYHWVRRIVLRQPYIFLLLPSEKDLHSVYGTNTEENSSVSTINLCSNTKEILGMSSSLKKQIPSQTG
ncbi:hypothetical protein AV530_013889 [Patagioenas fasciata monilis]|uniref:Uncharacterized protein n=1 Tax=Patagioenas fasciata monilis TaxID=372326 RepID=A0A1V4KMU2_PATFA|nr:hypothetical protein AV530_013889 [Patagioenas fasciata monilis]